MVASNDIHYIKKEDARAHEILLCIQTATNLDDPKRLKFATDEFYFNSPEEMNEKFSEIPQAIQNSVHIAEKYIYNYFFRYQGVKRYIEREKEEARKKGYIITLLKRRRYLEGINSKDKNIREFNERIAINTPIQGSAADLIKIAMIKISESIKKERFKSKLLLQIHDELIFEVYKPELEKVKSIIKDIMEHSLELSVPLKVNLKVGDNWAEVS